MPRLLNRHLETVDAVQGRMSALVGHSLGQDAVVEDSTLVNVAAAARILSVSTKSVRRWDAKLAPFRNGNGHRRYDPTKLREFAGGMVTPRRSGALDRLYLGSCERMALRDRSVHLILTSPPYPRKYRPSGNMIAVDEWIGFMLPKAREFRRVLRHDGNLVVVVREPVVDGERSLVVWDFVRAMKDEGWRFVDELIWQKTNPLPGRSNGHLKDAYERILHFSLSPDFKWHADQVRRPVKEWHGSARPVRRSTTGFRVVAENFRGVETALPSNVIELAHTNQNLLHDAVHPVGLAEFLVKLMTVEGDVVLDPFAGSGTTLIAAKRLGRRWVGYEIKRSAYLTALARMELEAERTR